MGTLRSGQASATASLVAQKAFSDLSDAPAPEVGKVLGWDAEGDLANITVAAVPSYGEAFEYNLSGSAIALTAQNTDYRWITGEAGPVKGAGYVTWNDDAAPTGKRLTIGASGAGVYLVTATFTGNLAKHADLSMDVYVNAAAVTNITCDFHVTEDNSYVAGSAGGMLTLAAGDTVTMWFSATVGTNTFTIKHGNLTLLRIE